MMQLKGPKEIPAETTGEQTKHIPLGIYSDCVGLRNSHVCIIPIMTSKEKDEQPSY